MGDETYAETFSITKDPAGVKQELTNNFLNSF